MFCLLWQQRPLKGVSHAEILHQNLRHSSFWNPQITCSFSHCPSPIFVDCSLYTLNILRHSACCRPSRTDLHSFNRFSTTIETLLPHFIVCTALIATSLKAFHIIQVVSVEEYLNSSQNLVEIHCSTSLVILNAMATQYTWSINGIYCPL